MIVCKILKQNFYRLYSTQVIQSNIIYNSQKVADLFQKQSDSLQVIDDYLTDNEYNNFLKEIDGYMKRKRYEYSHWDDVCSRFKIVFLIKYNLFYVFL
jgi:hypothetical protein